MVLDSSVLVKWFKRRGEEYLAEAEALREIVDERSIRVHAPALVHYELGNLLLLKSGLDVEELIGALAAIRRLPIVVTSPTFRLLARGAQLARDFDITFYDASFVAVAAELRCPLVTADDRLTSRLRDLDFVVPLPRIEGLRW